MMEAEAWEGCQKCVSLCLRVRLLATNSLHSVLGDFRLRCMRLSLARAHAHLFDAFVSLTQPDSGSDWLVRKRT